MFNWLFGRKSKSRLGIDLGSSSIKIAELEIKEGKTKLINYALAQTRKEAVFKIGEMKEAEISSLLRELIKEAKIDTRRASISLPVERTFTTVMDLPSMPEKELMAAIPFEAQKYVPVPVEEVVLDWTIIPSGQEQKSAQNQPGRTGIQVLLVAVPREIINKITKIAKMAGLEIAALEQEAFSLARSLLGNDKSVFMIVDLGRKDTDLIVVDQGFIRLSHNLESTNKELILMEIDRVVNIYQMKYNKRVGQCVLTGGRANEKEFLDFLSSKLKMPVKVGDPFARLAHEPALEPALKEIAPQFSVAVGLAMRES